MDYQLSVFSNEQFGDVRTAIDEKTGEPWFCGLDVCNALGYDQARKAIERHVDGDDGMKRTVIDNLGREQDTTFINESGLYSLILSSKLPQAKIFKRWVTKEVLPSIRKYGAYATQARIDQEKNESREMLRMARALVAAHDAQMVAEGTMKKQDVYLKKLQSYRGKNGDFPTHASSALRTLGGEFLDFATDFFFKSDDVYGVPQDMDTMLFDFKENYVAPDDIIYQEMKLSTFRAKVNTYCAENDIIMNPSKIFYPTSKMVSISASKKNYFTLKTWCKKRYERTLDNGNIISKAFAEFKYTEHGVFFYRKGVDVIPKNSVELIERYKKYVELESTKQKCIAVDEMI